MKREVTVIETHPFSLTPMRRYILASETEREHFKSEYPDLNIRVADKEEQFMLAVSEEEVEMP